MDKERRKGRTENRSMDVDRGYMVVEASLNEAEGSGLMKEQWDRELTSSDDNVLEAASQVSGDFCLKFPGVNAELRTVLTLALAIFLGSTAFIPVETLQSSLNSEAGLGTYSLACIYGPYCIFALAAPCIIHLITPKWTVFTSSAINSIYIAVNFYPTWYTLIPASIMSGSIASSMWTSKDLFVSTMARLSVKKSIGSEDNGDFIKRYQSKLSFYNGIIFAAMSFAGVVGQLISSAVLTQSSAAGSSIENCGPFSCPGLGRDVVLSNVTNVTTIHRGALPETYLIYTLLGILCTLIFMEVLLLGCCLQNISSDTANMSCRSTMFSCVFSCVDRRMLLLIPQFVFFTFPYGLILSDYTKSYITCGIGVGMVGYMMIFSSLSATIASIVCGRLVKFTGRRFQVVVALLGYAGVHTMMWIWKPSSDDNISVYIIIPVVFGASEVVFHTHLCTVMALLFRKHRAAAFANFYMFRSLSKAASFLLSGFLCVWIKLIISSVLLGLATASFAVLEVVMRNHEMDKVAENTVEVMISPVGEKADKPVK